MTGRIRLDETRKKRCADKPVQWISYMEEQSECLRIFDEKSVQLMNQYGLDITTPYERVRRNKCINKKKEKILYYWGRKIRD